MLKCIDHLYMLFIEDELESSLIEIAIFDVIYRIGILVTAIFFWYVHKQKVIVWPTRSQTSTSFPQTLLNMKSMFINITKCIISLF